MGEGPQSSAKRKAVLLEYGGWLSESHKQEDAAVAFLAAGDLKSALTQYAEGNHWRMALSVAGSFLPKLQAPKSSHDTVLAPLGYAVQMANSRE